MIGSAHAVGLYIRPSVTLCTFKNSREQSQYIVCSQLGVTVFRRFTYNSYNETRKFP
jgi:hypothetical protein